MWRARRKSIREGRRSITGADSGPEDEDAAARAQWRERRSARKERADKIRRRSDELGLWRASEQALEQENDGAGGRFVVQHQASDGQARTTRQWVATCTSPTMTTKRRPDGCDAVALALH